MSDETTSTQEAAPVSNPSDELKNVKAEFERKLANQNAQMQQLLASIQKPTQTETKKVSVFEDEDAYARRISEETERRIEAKLEARYAAQNKQQQIVNSIVQDYPEANDTTSELYKRANEIYSGLDSEEKASHLSMKTAVAYAAAELGIKPKAKRSSASNADSFSIGSTSKPTSSKKQSDLDAQTESFAQMMGLNLSDPKVRERLATKKPLIRR